MCLCKPILDVISKWATCGRGLTEGMAVFIKLKKKTGSKIIHTELHRKILSHKHGNTVMVSTLGEYEWFLNFLYTLVFATISSIFLIRSIIY